MLDVLSKYDPKTAAGVLAAVALSNAPNPGLDEPSVVREYKGAVDAVLGEIRQKLKLKEGDSSPRAKLAIDQFVSRALGESVFHNKSAEEAIARAGQAGRLSPSLYRVRFAAEFERRFRSLGIRKQHVRQAIHEANDVQHLMTDPALDETDVFSLFMKLVPLKVTRAAHWLLVQTVRRGAEQTATAAWRVIPSEVELGRAEVPLDVLRAFTKVYGHNLRIGRQHGTLLMDEKVQHTTEDVTWDVEFDPPIDTAKEFFLSSSYQRTKNPNIANVGIAYCINVEKYRASLVRHGLI